MRALRAVPVVLALLLAGACSAGPATSAAPSASSAPPAVDYSVRTVPNGVPDQTSDVFLPARSTGRVPVVVLVPGGGWLSADRTGLRPLAEALAAAGFAVASTSYRTAGEQASFPVPLEDVVCAVDDAVERVTSAGLAAGPVVIVGHSAGAQLAALAALVGGRYQRACPRPSHQVDALVGLAGPYDVARIPGVALALFGVPPQQDPQAWRDGNPLAWAGERSSLPVLLLHGDSDRTVPASFSEVFAAALEEGGHRVTLRLLAGADHASIYRPARATEPIAEFVRSLR